MANGILSGLNWRELREFAALQRRLAAVRAQHVDVCDVAEVEKIFGLLRLSVEADKASSAKKQDALVRSDHSRIRR